MHFVRKIYARWILPSGKFRLFGPLNAALMMIITTTLVVQYHHHYYDQRDHSYKQYHDEHHHHRPCCAIPSSGSPLPFIGTHWTVGIVLSPTPATHHLASKHQDDHGGGRMMQTKYKIQNVKNQTTKGTGLWVLSSLLLLQCIILYITMIILLSVTYSDCLIFNILDFAFCFHHPVHDHYHLAVSYFEIITIKTWELLFLRISLKLRRQPEQVRG